MTRLRPVSSSVDVGYAYGHQTAALAAQDDGDRMYPCPTCGGIGYVGQNLDVPCWECKGHGEVYDPPRRRDRQERSTLSPEERAAFEDPWKVPGVEAGPPPF